VQQGEPEDVHRAGAQPEHEHERRRQQQRAHRPGRHQGNTGHEHGAAEHPGLRDALLQHRQTDHADGHAEPEGGDEEAEVRRRVGVAEHLTGEDGAEGHEHAAADQPGRQADVDRAHHRVQEDELPPLLDLGEHPAEVDAVLVLGAAQVLLADRQPRDDVGGDGEQHDLDVERHRLLADPKEVEGAEVAQPRRHLGQQGEEDRRDRERAVGGGQRQRVGRREVVGRHHVGHRRGLGRREEQRADLEHERGEHQAEQRVDERQRRHHHGPGDGRHDHDLLAVHPVDQHAGAGGEEEARRDPGGHHDADRRAARPGADPIGQRHDGEEAEPVAERGDDLGRPETEELDRPEHPELEPRALGLGGIPEDPQRFVDVTGRIGALVPGIHPGHRS
jgi:hypothetical protein